MLHDLVGEYDVVFEQFHPGVVEGLGIDHETLTEHREDIVHCSLTGYGQTGPDRNRAGHDLNYAGVSGLLDLTRPPANGPGPRTRNPADAPGLPRRGHDRGADGRDRYPRCIAGAGTRWWRHAPRRVDDRGATLVGRWNWRWPGDDPVAGETPLSGSTPWYGVYETADGRAVTLAALEPRFFRAFCEAVDRPDLLESHLTRETAERAHLRSELESLFAGRTRAEWLDLLGEDTMVGPVNTPAEALVDPHLGERDVFTDTPAGHRHVRVPALSTGSGDPGAVPALGTYADAVLAEHGFDTATVAELREDGIVH